MPQTIEMLCDVASPNAYFAYTVLRRSGAEAAYTPVLLGGVFKLTGNQTPMTAFSGVKGKIAYEMKEIERFREKHGLDAFRFNSRFPMNTILPQRTATAAAARGQAAACYDAVMAAMWEADRDIADPEVLAAVLDEAGLDGAGLVAAAGEQGTKDALRDATQAAVDRGVFGLPSFFVGDEMWFGKERLDAVLEAAA